MFFFFFLLVLERFKRSTPSNVQELFHIARELGLEEERLDHVMFGNIGGMSSRKGSAVLLKDYLDEARDKMFERMKDSPTNK